MKSYTKYFGIPIIITLVIVAVCVGIGSSRKAYVELPRDNEYFDNTICVYDWADKLTDAEEAALAEEIMYWQEVSCVDIVWITMDEAELGYLDSVKQYADSVAEDAQMGYYGPGQGAIVFVDNWSRGGDGKIHTWISTTGSSVRDKLSNDEVTEILNVLDELTDDSQDPYYQYMKILDDCGRATRAYHPFAFYIPLIAGIIAAGIFIAVNWRSKLGDVTVTSATYLKDGKAHFKVSRDVFRNKTVTKHKIESSSSGGSGGGGGSHGGGGHSR